jgi:hypothetical protein
MNQPITEQERALACAKAITGLTLEKAETVIKECGFTSRKCAQDGKYAMVTRDVDMTRINLYILKGFIESAHVG